ncbi:MAG: threonine/serine exporter family protein [Eubacteriales bacterium]|nr:threonine/serine exporter family protein [Eubacteriales bacterium]
MVETVKLIILSFFASLGFGIVFRIEKKNLLWAALGGALTRCFYLFVLSLTDQRLIYSVLASIFAALYAEIMAARQKMPSTVFLYPSIIPLIPGDLLYNTAVGFLLQDASAMATNARDCALTLVGMSVGFVIVSTITYYKRIYYVGKNFMGHLLQPRKQ